MSSAESPHAWPGDTLTRVPYWVYQDDANYRAELRRIFEGPVWSYVCLESDVERPGELRTTTLHGLVFASLSPEAPPLAEYLGQEILGRIERVLHRPVRVLGRFVQVLPNNWKLYVENVKDTYHASLLHAFFGTFRITRLTQGGGIIVSPDGGHHASYTIDRADDR